jgi:hypothetical protein
VQGVAVRGAFHCFIRAWGEGSWFGACLVWRANKYGPEYGMPGSYIQRAKERGPATDSGMYCSLDDTLGDRRSGRGTSSC